MGWLGRWMRGSGAETLPLYDAIVARARQPHWYLNGQVPDTVDGRFDMIAAVISFVLLRMEAMSEGAEPSARLTERFVADMDAQLRQMGIGDITVGKHIGRMMAMLGGRLGAYRDGLTHEDLDAALVRNLYRGNAPEPKALAHVRASLLAFREALASASLRELMSGSLP